MYEIRPAREQDVPYLAAIEVAAAALLEGHAPASVLSATTDESALRAAQDQGKLWVALDGDAPVGFALVRDLEPGVIHLEELDVHPTHGRRGLGTGLVRAVCAWAATNGFQFVTLTTFRDLPWNMPFYARLGFDVIPRAQLSPALRCIVRHERRRGLDASRRVVMRYQRR